LEKKEECNRHKGEENMNDKFREDLASLINKYSLENGSNTPDFILAYEV
jgi:hypothetical protein